MDAQKAAGPKVGLSEWFRDAWTQAMTAVGAAEEEAGRILGRAGELAGWSPEEIRKVVKELGEKLAAQRRQLEQSIDEGVARAVARVRIPTRENVAEIRARVERIAARIDALQNRR